MSTLTHTEKTNADAIMVAFDYQYYYFLYQLFKLDDEETVGLEVKDDVHTELNNDIQVLIQLKHSVLTKADNKTPINLSNLDTDLWHTLYNWCEVITDENDNRLDITEQLKFLQKTYFVLVTNKSYTKDNEFIQILNDFKNRQITLDDMREKINSITTKDTDIIKYKSKLLNLNNVILESFLKNIEFNLNEDNLIEMCKKALLSKLIPKENIDELFRQLDSSIREDNYIAIKNNQKIIISFSDFYKKYRIFYDKARNSEIRIKNFDLSLNNNLNEQKFIQYLIDIGDIPEDDEDSIIEFTKHKLQIENNINSWIHEAELTEDELRIFEEEAVLLWRNEFRKHTRGELTEEKIKEKSLNILDAIREKKLTISSLNLDIQHSNGEFYSLSDNLKIGWRKDWKEKYNG